MRKQQILARLQKDEEVRKHDVGEYGGGKDRIEDESTIFVKSSKLTLIERAATDSCLVIPDMEWWD